MMFMIEGFAQNDLNNTHLCMYVFIAAVSNSHSHTEDAMHVMQIVAVMTTYGG